MAVAVDHKERHALLERAAGLMVKAGYSSLGVKVKVAGKEKGYVFMESSVYMKVRRGTPPTGSGPKAK